MKYLHYSDPEVTLIDTYNEYGTGGVAVVATDSKVDGRDVFFSSKSIAFTDKGAYTLNVEFDNEEGFNEGQLGEYRVYLKVSENEEDNIIIRDFSRDYSTLSCDISRRAPVCPRAYQRSGRTWKVSKIRQNSMQGRRAPDRVRCY